MLLFDYFFSFLYFLVFWCGVSILTFFGAVCICNNNVVLHTYISSAYLYSILISLSSYSFSCCPISNYFVYWPIFSTLIFYSKKTLINKQPIIENMHRIRFTNQFVEFYQNLNRRLSSLFKLRMQIYRI